MTTPKLWPEVAAALDELNAWARTALAIGPQTKPANAKPFPWPSWAPAPGTWVRQAYQGPSKRVLGSKIWHVAGDVLVECELNRLELEPLCGRRIAIEPDGDLRRRAIGVPHVTFDVRMVGPSWPIDDRECQNCLRRLKAGLEFGSGIVRRPWGDRSASEYTRSILRST